MAKNDPLKGVAKDPLAGFAKRDLLPGFQSVEQSQAAYTPAAERTIEGTSAYYDHAALDYAIMHPNPDDPYWNNDQAQQGFQSRLEHAKQVEDQAIKEGHGVKAAGIDFARTLTSTVHDAFVKPAEHDVMRPEPGFWKNAEELGLNSPIIQAGNFTEHAIAGIVGWTGGLAYTALGEPQKGTELEAAFHAAGEQLGVQGAPTTPGGDLWTPFYSIFAPLTAVGHAGEVLISTDVHAHGAWMHYTKEAVAAGPMILAAVLGGRAASKEGPVKFGVPNEEPPPEPQWQAPGPGPRGSEPPPMTEPPPPREGAPPGPATRRERVREPQRNQLSQTIHQALRYGIQQTVESDHANAMLHEQQEVALQAPDSEMEIQTNARINAASAAQPLTPDETAVLQNVEHGMDGIEVQNGPPEDLTPDEQAMIDNWKADQRTKRAEADLANETQRLSAQHGEETARARGWRQAIDNALGPHAAVFFVHDEDGLPKHVRERAGTIASGKRRGGLHDSATGHVYLLTSSIKSAAEAVWTAAHEIIGHAGFQGVIWDKAGVELGGVRPREALAAERSKWFQNRTVANLARAIAKQRGEELGPIHTEEAMAELAAADTTGNWVRLKETYGRYGFDADLSPVMRGEVRGILNGAVAWLRHAMQKVMGVSVTDLNVRKMLEAMRRNVQGKAMRGDSASAVDTGVQSMVGEDGEGAPYTPENALDFSDLDTLDQEFPTGRGRGSQRKHGTRVWSIGQSGLNARGQETLRKMAVAEGSWAKGLESLRSLMNSVRGMVPDAASPKNAAAASTIIDRIAGAKLDASRYMRIMRSFHRAVARLTPEQQMALWRLGEQGDTGGVALPEKIDWAGLISYIRSRHDKAYETIGWARGYPPKYRKNHLARFVRRPDGMVYDSSVPPSMREAFENAREFATTDEALNAGFQLISPNIIDHEIRWAQSVQRFVARWSTLREMAKQGIVKIVPDGYEPKPDEVLIHTPDRRATMAIPAHVAQLLQNSVMHAPLTGPWARFWRGIKILGSSMASPMLAGNPYHGLHLPLFVAFPSYFVEGMHAVSDMPWGPSKVLEIGKAFGNALGGMVRAPKVRGERMSAGRALRLMSGKEGGASIDPLTGRVSFPAEDPADVALGVIRGTHDPAAASDPAIEVIRRLALSGMDISGQGEWRNAAFDRMREAIDDVFGTGTGKKKIGATFRAAGWFFPTLFRGISAPVMDWEVPRMKVRAFLRGAEQWYEANPGKEGTIQERLAMQALGREIEQRYGEMTTDNLLWNKSLTAALQGSMLSFSWNVSGASQLLGGLGKDVPANIFHFLRGDDPALQRHRSRLMYSAAYMAGGLFLGYLTTHFVGGQQPKTLKDLVYPIVGKDDTGKPVRIKMPWLGNDFGSLYYHTKVGGPLYAVKTLATDKAAPLIGFGNEIVNNRNFYGEQVVQPLDPWYEQAGQAFNALVGAEEPIPLQSMQHQHAQLHGAAQKLFDVANAMSITQAPSYVDLPIPVQQIYYLNESQGFRGTEPYDRALLHRAERQYHLRDLFAQAKKTGNAVPFTRAMTQFVSKHPMTQRQVESLVNSFEHPAGYSTLQQLPEADQAFILHNMESDPKLLLQYWGAFSDQVRATVDQDTIKKLEALNQAH